MIMVTESKVINDINSRSDVAIIRAFILSVQVNYRVSFDTSMYLLNKFQFAFMLVMICRMKNVVTTISMQYLIHYPFSVD